MAREAPEGIVFSSSTGFVDVNDVVGKKYKDSEILGLSKSQIETVDLLLEGPIEGLTSGTYTYSGNLGEIGWRTVSFSGFNLPTGFSGVQFLRSIYWNEIPVLGDNTQFNFQSVNVKQTLGKPNGENIQVLSPYQTVSRTIAERLRAGPTNSKTYRILNKDCRAVVINIKIPTLSSTDTETGDLQRTSIEYIISYKPVFSDKNIPDYILGKKEFIFGKVVASNGYIRTTRIDFQSNVWDDPNFIGWEIKIERITPESISSFLQNQTYIESITEIQGNIYTFPNSAMVRSLFDAEFFQSVPERAFDTQLLKVKIPGNYDPILKSYTSTGFAISNGGWNGEFKTGLYWTDNPAWCYYDLLINKRYGLGKYIEAINVDKFNLYEIAKYCDTLVADGFGGLEPRFTCNMLIGSREEAYKIVNDMASIFRGLTYYANGSIFATQDSPKEAIVSFTNANVEEGNFNYSTSSRKTRHSIAIVRYNDPKNFYKPSVEYVEDFDAIRKYGIRELELTAFGCTSRGQAIRLGRWALLSNNLEPESVNFIAGLEANYLRPGDVFKISDINRKSKRHGGRLSSIKNLNNLSNIPTGSEIVLDYKVNLEPNIEYNISILTPSFNYDPTQTTGVNSNDSSNIRKSFIQKFSFSGFQSQISGNKSLINLYSGFDTGNYFISGNPVWILELSDKYSTYTGQRYFTDTSNDYYRVINIIEKDVHRYQVEGLQYNPQKYIEIESGLLFERTVLNKTNIPFTPYNLSFNIFDLSNNLKAIDYSFLVDDFTNIDSFQIYVKKDNFSNNGVPDNNYLISTLPSNTTFGRYIPRETGNFYFRIYSSNDKNGILSSSFATGLATIYSYNPIKDVIISTLQVNNITGIYTGNSVNRNVTFVRDNDLNPTFTWQVGYSNNNFISGDIRYRVTIRPFNDLNTRIPQDGIVLETTGISDNFYTFSLESNIVSSGGPYRDYQVVVEAHDKDGNTSAGNKIGVQPDNNWNNFPNGYDILGISNPRQTGIELSNSLPTQIFGGGDYFSITGNYISKQYMSSNGDIVIQFTSGEFDSDLIGGYIYVSSVPFAKSGIFASTSFDGVRSKKTEFQFNPQLPTFNIPSAAFNVRGAPYCFASISFFDTIDKVLIDRGIDVSTQLYISNNSIIYNDAAAGSISIGGVATLYAVQTTGYPAIGSNRMIELIGSGTVIIRTSTSGTVNEPGNRTTIFYISAPLLDLYTGISQGNPRGGGGDSVQLLTGKKPGGFRRDSQIATGFDSNNNLLFMPITGLTTGQSVVSFVFTNSGIPTDSYYNYITDNWKSVHYADTSIPLGINNLPSGSLVTGFVTNIISSNVSGYVRIKSSAGIVECINFTKEQPIFFFTGLSANGAHTGRFLDGNTIATGFMYANPGGSVEGGYLSASTNLNIPYIAKSQVNDASTLISKIVDEQTGFYAIEVKPYNTFFIRVPSDTTAFGGNPINALLCHNSIYDF